MIFNLLRRFPILLAILFLFSIFFVVNYFRLSLPHYLSFSDGAKFADIARNIVYGLGYNGKFSFWTSGIFDLSNKLVFSSLWTPPLMPFSIAAFFKMFGVNDFAVIATSFFYFILTLIFVFLLAKKIFKSNLVGILSALAVGFNYDLINYATSGASESPFIFEIVASVYFLALKKRWTTVVGFILLVLMYFTRPQAFIYIAGLILFYLLSRLNAKKAMLYFLAVAILGFLVDRQILAPLGGKYFLYPIIGRGVNAISQYTPGSAVSDAIRGNFVSSVNLLSIFKKVFYNLYNFFKLMPQIMSPYLFGLFLIGLFRWTKDKTYNAFKVSVIFMFAVTFLIAALSIPFFRYLHPVVPLIYIVAIATIVEIFNFKISKQMLVIAASTFLIIAFGVGQTLGVIFLDSRFERNTHNVGKPPVYVQLSYVLKNNTRPDQMVLTNLDTWGSWYGERKTVWYPLTPEQIITPKGESNPFDVIYLTSYLKDDQNYFMGEEWRRIFENPTSFSTKDCAGCEFIKENYKLGGIYKVSASEDYERQDARAILLIKKN